MNYIPLSQGRQYVPGIYCIESSCGKVYIGSAVSLRTRFMSHRRSFEINKHDNERLQNYCNKYGTDSLSFKVLEYCDRDRLIEREQFYIDTLNPFFNIARTAGATYGLKPWLNKKHTEETKAKIKAASLETFAKRPKKIKPVKLTRQQNNERIASLNKTPERRKRSSDLHKGNTYWLGKKHKPETIANRTGALNPNSKKIYCSELNHTFDTGKDAAAHFGVGPAAITNAMRRGNKIKGQFTLAYAA